MKNRTPSFAVVGNVAVLLLLLCVAILMGRLHEGLLQMPAPSASRTSFALVATLLWLALCAGIFLIRRRRQKLAEEKMAAMAAQGTGRPWLVAWASQTGFAEKLAWQTAETLQGVGLPVRLLPLSQVNETVLQETENALFAVSTTGEGDAPDAALGFARRLRESAQDLSGLRYGMLALGDRSYSHYCAFGHQLDNWLQHSGAEAHFDMVEVDNGDAATLRHWQHHLSVITGHTEMADWSKPDYGRWRLDERVCLNPGSAGAPVFFVAFAPVDGEAQWQAGDIVEIGPRNSLSDIESFLLVLGQEGHTMVIDDGQVCSLHEAMAARALPHDAVSQQALHEGGLQALLDLKLLPHREYSIASVPADGRIELILRQMRQPDGKLGVGSGWLTEHAPVGGEIALRIRENRSFHGPVDDRPLILIGNGTGIAGLRAHIRARELKGQTRNWLLFGERNAEYDFHFREQLQDWQRSGVLQRLDLAFSRDQEQRIYVQDRLREAAHELRAWVDAGAAIYVCGSLAGMAPAVAAVLKDVLGEELLEQMAEDGRYRRDVY
ncbi:MAG: sulfite reductase subunit alpha [Pedobacter sp.]|nr:sulfite reductase subunit alpha [Pedobacter sp.]